MTRCSSEAPKRPTPEEMTPETAAGSPAHRHLLEPGARCELEDGHDGPHRAGAHLIWHAPPLIVREARPESARAAFDWL